MTGNPLKHFSDGQAICVTLVKSPISSLKRHKDGLRTLGLRKIGQSRSLTLSPTMRGIVHHCIHLLKIEAAAACAQ